MKRLACWWRQRHRRCVAAFYALDAIYDLSILRIQTSTHDGFPENKNRLRSVSKIAQGGLVVFDKWFLTRRIKLSKCYKVKNCCYGTISKLADATQLTSVLVNPISLRETWSKWVIVHRNFTAYSNFLNSNYQSTVIWSSNVK